MMRYWMGALADNALYLAQIHLEVADVYRIDQSDRLIIYQVRVVGNPVRQRPHAFKQMLIAVIHSHVSWIFPFITVFGFIVIIF